MPAGYSGYLGSGIAYTSSYTKELSIEDGIRNYQYLDRLAAMYAEHGVELHRRQPGFLTGTNIPPCIAITTAVLDLLLAAAQGVKNYGLEMGQTLHLVQDAAAVRACGEMCQEYLQKQGYSDVFTPVTLLHWMGAWPHDDAQATALVCLWRHACSSRGRRIRDHEDNPRGIWDSNAEGKRRRLAHDPDGDLSGAQHSFGLHARIFSQEVDLIKREVRPVVDKVLEMGDGDVGARHCACRGGGGARCAVVAKSLGEERRDAGARCGRVLENSGPRIGADPARSHGSARGKAATGALRKSG